MIHVIEVFGQADWIDLTTARVWQQSPIADSLITQIASGGAGRWLARVCGEVATGDPPG